jgi:predicted transcriptional regulator
MALLQQNDILFAQKALLLMPGLADASKRVAGAIIDHFNKQNGQCEPSIERLVTMLELSRASVLRATKELCELGLVEKDSHGGKHNQARYRPQWHRFRQFVADWDARMKTGAAPGESRSAPEEPRAKVAQMRPTKSHLCDVGGIKNETQTLRNNQSKKPIRQEQVETQTQNEPPAPVQKCSQGLSKIGKQPMQRHLLLPMQGGKQVSHSEAARNAAQRRWEREVKCLGEHVYSAVAEWITLDRQHAATDAELQRKGGGWEFIASSMHNELRFAHG